MKNKKTLLWIDDIRNPQDPEWTQWIHNNFGHQSFKIIWVKSYIEFKSYIDENGIPDNISFDHDLGDVSDDEKTGMTCCNYLIEYCMDHKLDIPTYRIQSSNIPGAKNIKSKMDNWHKFYQLYNIKNAKRLETIS